MAAASVTVLGSGTLLPDGERSSAAHLIRTPAAQLLLDCGSGTLHGLPRHGIAWQTLTHVAISHYHNDHVGDLSGLLFALKHAVRPARITPLVLLGPPGFADFLDRLAEALGEHVRAPGFPLDVHELAPGQTYRDEAGGFTLQAAPTPHTSESIAYRWEGREGCVGYTGDTGPSDTVAHFLKGADVLIAECALTDPPEMDGHLSPVGLAAMLGIAQPGTAVVTHVYPPLSHQEAVVQIMRAGYAGTVLPGFDGQGVPLGP
jgi:ribonuclease BN (tRNA processing enzyme)